MKNDAEVSSLLCPYFDVMLLKLKALIPSVRGETTQPVLQWLVPLLYQAELLIKLSYGFN